MNNNDIFRRLRYIFDYKDRTLMKFFHSVDFEVTVEQITAWLKQDDDDGFKAMNDQSLAAFLNALIIDKRGRRDDKPVINEKHINNNSVFRKLKIALAMTDEDIVDVFESVDLRVSKHEVNALFRGQTQKQYRPCKDQFLRNFLMGLQFQYRDKEEG